MNGFGRGVPVEFFVEGVVANVNLEGLVETVDKELTTFLHMILVE